MLLFWLFISLLFAGGYKGKQEFLEFIKIFLIGIGIVLISFFVGGWGIFLFLTLLCSFVLDYKSRKIKREWDRLTSKINHIKGLKAHKEKEKFKSSQRAKGLESFEGKWVTKSELKKLKETKIGLDKNFQNLSSYGFEKFIAKLFKAMGYKTRVTQASKDYGIDVVAEKGHEKIAIQCKRYEPRNPVGNRDIQRLLGAMQQRDIKATHSILITTSHFTVQAREQAKECATELWDGEDLKKMVKKYLMEIK